MTNEAEYGKADCDDAQKILGIDLNAHELEFVCVIEKSTIYAMARKNARGKIACLKPSSRHELMQDKTSGTGTTRSATSKTRSLIPAM